MREEKGKKKGIRKAGTTVISATLLGAGAAGIAFAYQSGAVFHPSGKNQELKKNQIVFSKDKKMAGQNEQKEKDNSRFLKNDENNDQGAQTHDNADYMFQNGMMMSQQQQVRIATNTNVTQANNASETGNNDYQVTNDPSKADIVVNRPSTDHSNDPTSTDQSNSDQNNNNSNDNSNNDNSNNSNSDNSQNNDHTNSDNNDNNTTDNDSNNDKRPSDTAKDPDSEKTKPNDGLFVTRPFEENPEPFTENDENGDNISIVIQQSDSNPNAVLYKGQSVTAKDLYNSLDTYVRGKDLYAYAFGDNEYGQYIRIDGVSFDEGKTWKNGFPTEIPSDIETGQMKIKVSYRLSQKQENWITRYVDYEPKSSRIFLLSQQITEENSVISDDIFLNKYEQNPEPGTKMNLLRAQLGLLGSDRLTALFPGWTEKGKLQPWFYEVTAGRHILEPSDFVPLDDKYIVKVLHYWMAEDYQIDFDKGMLCYLQTLTDMNEAITISWGDTDWTGNNLYQKIQVPKYVQAVAIDQDADISVNELEIPDTVLYIKVDDTGMRVNDKYTVDAGNQTYTTQSGMLMSKDKTEILSIPYNMKKIKINETVNKVCIDKDNHISEIDLSAKSFDQIPEIAYKNIKNCKIVVQDEALVSYIRENYKNIFANKGNTIAAASDPDQTYTVDKGIIMNREGRVIMLLDMDNQILNLTNQMTSIAEDVFKNSENLKTIVMPESGKVVTLEENSLRNSKIEKIHCYTKEQYDNVVKQLGDAKAPENLVVELINTSVEGYKYCVEAKDGEEKVVLLSVPKEIHAFDGKMTNAEDQSEIKITEISNEAFAQCQNLKWVTLSESTKKIGYGAFKDCANLEGVLIESKDEITIADQSFEGCDSLRFIGSNAKKGIMENDYQPIITDTHNNETEKHYYFYVPGDYEGYNKACTSLNSGSDTSLSGYRMEDIGSDAKMLYGVDDKGNSWLAIRSGKEVPDEPKLPKQTKEFFNFAMADTTSESGEYHIAFNKMNLWAIDKGAFHSSQLGGDIVMNDDIAMFEQAMAYCDKIKTVTIPGDVIYLDKNIFVECSNLESVKIGKISKMASIESGMFSGCDHLADLTLESEGAEQLSLAGVNGYQFNYQWTPEEEAEKLRIHIPNGSEKKYIKGWRYTFAGSVATNGDSAYANMRSRIQLNNINWDTWEFPTDEEIDEIQKKELVVSENRIRKMLGMSCIQEPTELYLYHESGGMVTLADVPSVTKEIDLETQDMELPEGWYLDYIGTGAFKNAKNLTNVRIPDNMTGIENDAFKGVKSESLTLQFDAKKPLEFVLPNANDPYQSHVFKFGVNDENLHIQVPEGLETDYLKAWIFPMVGYKNLDDMQGDVLFELWTGDDMPEDQEINETIAKRLLPVENRLRKMMRMEEINSIDEICCKKELGFDDAMEEQQAKEEKAVEPQIKETTSGEEQTAQSHDEITQPVTEDVNQKETEEDAAQETEITIPDTQTQLETDVYSEEKADCLQLTFEAEKPLKLHIKEEGKAFSFGKEDDKIKITVPKDYEDVYIEQWKYAMAGYEDLESMKKAITQENKEKQLTEEQVEEIISQELLLGENRLRKMMGMEELKK